MRSTLSLFNPRRTSRLSPVHIVDGEKLVGGDEWKKSLPLSLSYRTVWTVYQNKNIGAPERIRTSDRLVRSQVLYPAELRARVADFSTGRPNPAPESN